MTTEIQTNTQVQTQTKWVRMKMPEDVRTFIKSKAMARKMSMWQYVVQSINFYESSMREKELKDITKLQNDAWYAVKLTSAITEYIHKPNDENYQKLMKIITQIETRKHVQLNDMKTMISMYAHKRKKSLARAMLQACTRVFVDLATRNNA